MGLGEVHIVGAGPGAADLISLRALRALRRADVIIADRLLPRTFLEELGISESGRRVEWLGEAGDRPSQKEINRRMERHAAAGRRVVRLKGGDPCVFGRGGDEAAHLARAGVPFEIVPGQSSCIAAPTAAGVSVTTHAEGRSFAVTTARVEGGGLQERFPRADTLVIMMGVSALPETVDRLIRDGWPPDTPTAVIERGATIWERRVFGSLRDLPELAGRRHVEAPAVIVVGHAARRDAAVPRRRLLFTGLDPTRFRTLGDLIHWPALRITPDPDGHARAERVGDALAGGRYSVVVFTSKVGVASFFAALDDHGRDARALAGARIVAAGAGTEERLLEFGLRADASPVEGGSDGILSVAGLLASQTVLVVQGSHAPRSLVERMTQAGADVTRLSLHRVVPHPGLGRPLPEHDVVYFVSPSGVRAFAEAYGEGAFEQEIWCIGAVTLAEVNRLGFQGKVVSPHVPQNTYAKGSADAEPSGPGPGDARPAR